MLKRFDGMFSGFNGTSRDFLGISWNFKGVIGFLKMLVSRGLIGIAINGQQSCESIEHIWASN